MTSKGLSERIEDFSDDLIKDVESKPTLTVERGESTDLGEDYDLLEVLQHNITENIESARRAIPMLTKKEAHRVLFRLLEAGMVDQADSKTRLRTNIEVNLFEISNQIEMDKRSLVMKIQERAYMSIPGVLELLEQNLDKLNEGESNE